MMRYLIPLFAFIVLAAFLAGWLDIKPTASSIPAY